MSSIFLTLATAWALAASPTTLATGVHEPEPAVELSASLSSQTDAGPTVKVVVELAILPHVNLTDVRLRGSLNGSDETPAIPDAVLSLKKETVHKSQYELELDTGQVHHLVFSLRSEDTDDSRYRFAAYLKIDLGPRLEPEDLGHVLQFRATMIGR